jgi:hypothetical protein
LLKQQNRKYRDKSGDREGVLTQVEGKVRNYAMREDAVEDDVDQGVLDFFNSKNSKNKDLIAEIRPETAEFSRSRSRSNKTSDRPHTAVGPNTKIRRNDQNVAQRKASKTRQEGLELRI